MAWYEKLPQDTDEYCVKLEGVCSCQMKVRIEVLMVKVRIEVLMSLSQVIF